MNLLFLGFIVFILLFGFVILFGAPYLPTLKKQTDDALDLLDLKKGQTLLELGCGDGRVVKAAAKRGLNVIGYELNPILVIIAKINTFRYRKTTRIILGNYWQKQWPQTDAIFVFLLDKYMEKLDKRIIQQRAGQKKQITLLSFTFKIPGRKIDRQQGGLFLYKFQ